MLPDLSQYRLAFPVNPDGGLTGKCVTLEYPDFLTAYPEWFKVDGKRMIFRAPDGGAPTENTEFCRTELRGLKEYSHTEKFKDSVSIILPHVPDGGKIILDQIHDKNEAWYKLTYDDKGKLYARIRSRDGGSEQNFTLCTASPGDRVAISRIYTPKTANPASLWIRAKHKATEYTQTVNMYREGKYGKAYNKRGAYVQDKRRTGFIYEVIHV